MESGEAIENPEEVANAPKGERTEFPTDPEERFASIISAVGNHAGKQVTFLSIPSVPGVIITSGELHRAFLENSGKVWETSKEVQKDHAVSSLIPIGMVAEEVVMREGSDTELVGFTQTEAGREYGDPVSKFLLKYAAENDISFDKILGVTVSRSSSRAPYNRARILEYLSQRKNDSNIRFKDIQEHTSILSLPGVRQSLESLQDNDLLMFESVNPENTQGKFTYTLNQDFSGTPNAGLFSPVLVLEAIKRLQESSVTEFEIGTVLDEIRRNNPNYHRRTALEVLSKLARGENNYLTHGEFRGREILSTVTILQEGVDFTNDVLIPLRTALTDTPEGEELRHEWRNIPWRKYAPKALEKHKENSRQANMTDPAVVKEKLIGIIAEEPGIRSFTIRRRLKELGLPNSSTSKALRRVLKSGIVRKEAEGKAIRWFLVGEDEKLKASSETEF